MEVIRSMLSNGLRVVVLPDPSAPVVSFWVWYRVGARDERPGQTGISHWVEHMLFKGTPRLGRGGLDRLFARLGAHWNGFTTSDFTVYLETLPQSTWQVAAEVEADRMCNTVFDPEEVERERTVILSERGMYENDPASVLHEEVAALAFTVHPYRQPVIGWRTDLRRITREELLAHYRTYYRPNNATVVLVGSVSPEEALRTVEAHFGGIESGAPPPAVRIEEPPQEGERRVVVERRGGAVPLLQMAYRVPAGTHPDTVPLLVLDAVLSGGKPLSWGGAGGMGRSSRLYRALVRTRLAAAVTSRLVPSLDPGLLWISVTAQPGVQPEVLESAVEAELAQLREEPPSEEELRRAIKQLRAQLAYGADDASGRALWLGFVQMLGLETWFADLPERLERVTPEEVQRVARTYLVKKTRTVGWYLPEEAT
ncbi:MAG: pitrilysin family protein [Armatimonadota bacterium]|nr:pitrilysin family protein [Armatimonadota bacterium]MDR7438702.1 pitrilysin family protein [Armatimonadota bacterium]MDR7563744.1 pitrilysin family protein [Armatimonadota bacterium]MDR7567322.1 pitrilysin family protein [Armatimonadota bacterium]MDR7602540.1 pitrilysin family protein [Armatimonadota bacterium]